MKWISVKERLPEYGEYVLAYGYDCDEYGYKVVRGCFYFGDEEDGESWFVRAIEIVIEVTHWMPLPEAPKEDSHFEKCVPIMDCPHMHKCKCHAKPVRFKCAKGCPKEAVNEMD